MTIRTCGHGRGLRRGRPGELVPGHAERRRVGDHPVVPPPGGHPVRPWPHNAINDWSSTPLSTAPDLGRLGLADPPPRAADGHDATTFPDLVPDANGQITYDVDNDGDGQTDSVWVDLGYPARRNAQGQLYKPLFAFMVIGLNGRIPLNTAGNLAGGGPATADHAAAPGQLGQRDRSDVRTAERVRCPATDARGATFTPPVSTVTPRRATRQVDNVAASTDVRLTQLRNLLAGDSPADHPGGTGLTLACRSDRADQRRRQLRLWNDWTSVPALLHAQRRRRPTASMWTATAYQPAAPRLSASRPRWQGVGRGAVGARLPLGPQPSPLPPYLNLVISQLQQPHPRRLLARTSPTYINGIPRDAADDNFNSFDPYPPATPTYNRLGEVDDLDFLDLGRGLPPPRRADAAVRGPGRHQRHRAHRQWDALPELVRPATDAGADQWGRGRVLQLLPAARVCPARSTPARTADTTSAVTFPWTSGPKPTRPRWSRT